MIFEKCFLCCGELHCCIMPSPARSPPSLSFPLCVSRNINHFLRLLQHGRSDNVVERSTVRTSNRRNRIISKHSTTSRIKHPNRYECKLKAFLASESFRRCFRTPCTGCVSLRSHTDCSILQSALRCLAFGLFS